ncbi:MAG: T9SS type A sorting domain-containing protein [Bacteroidia bacterium]
MKVKLYTFILALLTGTAFQLNAQCTVSITSLAVTGATVTAVQAGTGAAVPIQGWDWGDTQFGIGATASHTYAASGTYNICAVYADLLDTLNCQVQTCSTVTITLVGVQENAQPVTMLNAFPSPFATNANISYTLAQNSTVEIEVFDITGKLVTTLQNAPQTAGNHTLVWEATDVNAGVYFVRLKTGDATITRRIVKQ